MSIIVKTNEDSATIVIPISELKDLGIADGEELEISKENGEIILRPKNNDRKERILKATREIIEERKSALIELGKGHE